VSLGGRLGRLARGFVSNINDERLRETIRIGRERGETLRDAFGAAWRGAAEEWRAAAEERASEEAPGGRDSSTGRARWSEAWSEARQRAASQPYAPRKYSPEVLAAFHRLGLSAGSSLEEASRKRRELVKRYHPDRFADPEQRKRAERLTAEINAAHDAIERHLTRGR
jgi:hypothetical protein